jgi:hypothetical protein
MNPFEMVVAIVIVGCVAGVISKWIEVRAARRDAGDASADAEMQQTLRRLEQRIEALEAIVTDKRYHLKREFEGLDRS